MEQGTVRVRFAPSPTGPLHIGGVRTALYNYLFAKKYGGKLVLRIEDTDSTRFKADSESHIISSLEWLGIKFDEGPKIGGEFGPYKQSERKDIYKDYVKKLIESGKAYLAFDTEEELEQKRKEVPNFQYNSFSRMSMKNSLSLSSEEVHTLLQDPSVEYTVRFKVEPGQEVRVFDLIRGEIVVKSSNIDDKILWKKKDELPTYHLANVVDDHLMNITHVIRGEEWIPSTPLHVLLYEAFEWEKPGFAHLPLILKPEGEGKLAKRDGDKFGFPVYAVSWEGAPGYKEEGWYPEAVVNFLAFLGWNPGTEQEIFSLKELEENFDLQHVNKKGSRFDIKKAKWFNHEYILKKDPKEITRDFMPILSGWGINQPEERVEKVVALMKDRIDFLKELYPTVSYFFVPPVEYDEKSVWKFWKVNSDKVLEDLIPHLSQKKEEIMAWIKEKGYTVGEVMNALRVAVVGKAVGPEMFELINFLGPVEIEKRIKRMIEWKRKTSE